MTVEGLDELSFRREAVAQAKAGLLVGHPCGEEYRPDAWENPHAFAWWCNWLAGSTTKMDGEQWLYPQEPAGTEGVDWVR